MIILQISPEFTPDTGVGSVAFNLEREWRALGHDVRRFDLSEAGATWLVGSSSKAQSRLRLMARVLWFSTVGTVRARRAVAALPEGAASLCHNDALAGDIYVNHGVLQTAMRARGLYWWRMLRNPLHIFTGIRDHARYRSATHRVVINLTREDDQALKRVYPGLRPRTEVIGNGVDARRFRPPSEAERLSVRGQLGLSRHAIVSVFVGNEYERKGLFSLLDAVAVLGDRHHLIVVGGSTDMTRSLAEEAHRHGVAERCHIVGKQDPLPYLWAADLLAQPSAYESYGLVVTEALAAGVPVMSTAVGVAAEVIQPGLNGYLTDGTPGDMASLLRQHEGADRAAMASAARQSALDYTWDRVARKYVGLFEQLRVAQPWSRP